MTPQSAIRNTKYEEMIEFVREAFGLSESVPTGLSPLEGRGSDRTFFRVKWSHGNSAILIHYDPNRVENAYYADIAAFLHDIDVAAPRLIRHDSSACLILMEDLGDMDLWSLRETPWDVRRVLYQKTLAVAHRLHSFPLDNFPSTHVRLMESFGSDLYRWERDYFRDHFVGGVCGIELETPFKQKLEAELSALAERLAATTQCLVHRDLQSQNVMVRRDAPFLIDFQGMRFGSLFYDLASLLCDPYVSFSENERERLLSFYYGLVKRNYDWPTFESHFWEASAQRLMQALGAYGFLGLHRGIKSYLDHVPSGLGNLQFAAVQISSTPYLLELASKCQKAIEQKG